MQSVPQVTKIHRCYVHEATLGMIFGPLSTIANSGDTHRLLGASRSAALPFSLIALFPYIMVPLMGIPFLKYFLVPRPNDNRGFGQMMAVRILNSTTFPWS